MACSELFYILQSNSVCAVACRQLPGLHRTTVFWLTLALCPSVLQNVSWLHVEYKHISFGQVNNHHLSSMDYTA